MKYTCDICGEEFESMQSRGPQPYYINNGAVHVCRDCLSKDKEERKDAFPCAVCGRFHSLFRGATDFVKISPGIFVCKGVCQTTYHRREKPDNQPKIDLSKINSQRTLIWKPRPTSW